MRIIIRDLHLMVSVECGGRRVAKHPRRFGKLQRSSPTAWVCDGGWAGTGR